MNDRVTLTGLVEGHHDPILLWHWCFCHPLVQKLRSVIPIKSFISSLSCESCELGKHHRATFQSRVNNRSSSTFESVYSDI